MKKIMRSADSILLTEKRPARIYDEAYPIGNGAKGAMVFGGTEKEILALNDDTLWSGYPMDRFMGDGYDSLEKAKALIIEGKYVEADREISENFSCYCSQSYMPLGNLEIEFLKTIGEVRSYKRTLDLSRAVFSAKYYRGETKYEETVFASFPANAIIYRLSASTAGAVNASIKFTSALYSKTYTEKNIIYLEGECPVTSRQNIDRTDRKQLYFDEPEKRGIRFMAMADLRTDGGISSKLDHLEVHGASFIEIRIVDSSSFNGHTKHPFTEGKDFSADCKKLHAAILGADYSTLFKEHVKDYSKYFSRLTLDLGSNRRSAIPTSERMIRYQKGSEDKALPALLFNFGRYLTIAASRPGSEAMNLQGIWNDQFDAPWHANYTVNINTEMNYFATLAVGLREMYQPLLRLIEEVSQAGKETAERLYHTSGWCCHHNTDLWRHTQPVRGTACWLFWNAAGGWFCHHLMEYYEYTLDNKFLREKAYPIITGAVKFYLSQLTDKDGYRIVLPSTSPENSFICENGTSAVAETTEMTMAIVRELFGNYVKICETLDKSDEILEKVKSELPSLIPTMVGSDGRVLEWYGEREEQEVHHRHVSHLYALHPGHAITPEKTPELADACRKTLEVRGDEGTGWSLAWKSNFFARLGDGDHAFSLIKRQLRLNSPFSTDVIYTGGGGTYPNMLCAHPPFQIDGNFGAMSGIAEMLLQSELDAVHILPALPSELSSIGVKGICAKGKRSATIKVDGGKLIYCKIKGDIPKKITVCGKDMTDKFTPVSDGCVFIADRPYETDK